MERNGPREPAPEPLPRLALRVTVENFETGETTVLWLEHRDRLAVNRYVLYQPNSEPELSSKTALRDKIGKLMPPILGARNFAS